MLDGKHILITGASRGLGAAAAIAFSKQDTKLALMARSMDGLAKTRDACKEMAWLWNKKTRDEITPCTIVVNLTREKHLQVAVQQAKDFLGHIDVVLHCAGGGMGLKDPLLNWEDFRKLCRLNISVPAEINRLIAPEMIERRSGNLVHVGSIASSEAVGSVGYNTVRAALAGYVRSLGRLLSQDNIICTGILPGAFYSPGNSMARLEQSNPEAYNDFIQNRLPRNIVGQTDEIIPLLTLLCSDQASMMGGCLVPIDAGEGVSYIE